MVGPLSPPASSLHLTGGSEDTSADKHHHHRPVEPVCPQDASENSPARIAMAASLGGCALTLLRSGGGESLGAHHPPSTAAKTQYCQLSEGTTFRNGKADERLRLTRVILGLQRLFNIKEKFLLH